MAKPSKQNSLPLGILRLIVGLMVISTVLFAVGIALERTGEAGEIPSEHTEVQGERQEGTITEAAHNENNESAESREEHPETSAVAATTPTTEAYTETILGIDIENPVFVTGAIGVWLALIIGLWLFGRRILIPVIIVAVGTSLFDAVEIITQINRASMGIALLAALITILHLVVATLAWRVLRSPRDEQMNKLSSPA